MFALSGTDFHDPVRHDIHDFAAFNTMENEEDESHVSTPVACHQPSLSADYRAIELSNQEGIDSFSASLASMLDSTLNLADADASKLDNVTSKLGPRTIVLPIPIATSAGLPPAFASPEVHGEEMIVSLEDLPQEAATADITVGGTCLVRGCCLSYSLFLVDGGRFVETSSGAVARELKRLYDQQLGVGKDVRSPFAITAFINQHGKQMYRIR